jgi:hypothetical protein
MGASSNVRKLNPTLIRETIGEINIENIINVARDADNELENKLEYIFSYN